MSLYYRVLLDGADIYNPDYSDMILINPVTVGDVEEAGWFEFTIDSSHKKCDDIIPYGSTIEVLEDGESIFYGRPLPPTMNIYGQKKYHCEGALAFLNDVILKPLSKYVPASAEPDDDVTSQLPGDDEGKRQRTINVSTYIRYVFEQYNILQAKASRKLHLRNVSYTETTLLYNSGYKTCLQVLREEILPYADAYMVARNNPELSRIDVDIYIAYANPGNQPIVAGVNLLDFTCEGQEIFTAMYGRGAKKEDGDYVELSTPVTLDSTTVGKYGTLYTYQEFPGCTTETALRQKCQTYLSSQQFEEMSFDVNANDLHIVNSTYSSLKVGEKVQFSSPAHDINVTLVISRTEAHLDTGEKKVTLGRRKKECLTQGMITVKTNTSETTEAEILVEDAVIADNPNAVSSGAVYNAIEDLINQSEQPVAQGYNHWVGSLEHYDSEGASPNTIYFIR